jgi:uncharacterized protein YecE (DUF72 family)
MRHRTGNILVGTTSWTERTLIESGRFYPPDVKTAEQRLHYYATQFPIVEVDSSYYGLPSERNSELWVERTPDRFIFDIKAFRLFTQHPTPLDALPKDLRLTLGKIDKENVYYRDLPDEAVDELWERFHSALEPLRAAQKLGVVLFQFPPWFLFRPSNLDYIEQCAQRLRGDSLAIEFRTRSWFNEKHTEQTLDFEREHGMVHVVVDEPQSFTHSIPPIWEATTPDIAVFRLHGRNRKTWQRATRTAAERFDYLYSHEELEEFTKPVRQLAARARTVHVLFNNCNLDYAQRNALNLQRILQT